MEIASFVIACVSATGALWAVWYARAQKTIAVRATEEAKRSADAAADVAAIERERRAEEVAEADRQRVRFVLEHEHGHAYRLHNLGTDTAFGVHVDTGGMGVQDEVTDIDEFPSGDAPRYLLARTMDPSQADYVLVTWHHLADRSDPRRSARLYGP